MENRVKLCVGKKNTFPSFKCAQQNRLCVQGIKLLLKNSWKQPKTRRRVDPGVSQLRHQGRHVTQRSHRNVGDFFCCRRCFGWIICGLTHWDLLFIFLASEHKPNQTERMSVRTTFPFVCRSVGKERAEVQRRSEKEQNRVCTTDGDSAANLAFESLSLKITGFLWLEW